MKFGSTYPQILISGVPFTKTGTQ